MTRRVRIRVRLRLCIEIGGGKEAALDYVVEIYDTWGRRLHAFDDVPLLEAVRSAPDGTDRIRGLLPKSVTDLGIDYRVRVLVGGRMFCESSVSEVSPEWSDVSKLILDRYVSLHEVLEFRADSRTRAGNTSVKRAYTNQTISAIVRDVIQRALGEVHYTVDHDSYPDGAVREHSKFDGRKTIENELEIGGISTGQWVGSNRIDVTGAFAKDGDTIAGLKVDGDDWPDLRMMLIDSEETGRNSHAKKLHPEVNFWTDAEYDASGYKLAGDRAKVALQALLDTKGIDFIELNPHKNSAGDFDDRIDFFGRYLGLVYGGGECFNAAMVEQGHADVLLFDDGRFLVPELELKDFFSYMGVHVDSIEDSAAMLSNFDVDAGVLEAIAALGYTADGYIWEVGPDLAVSFRAPDAPDRVYYFDPLLMGVRLGSTDTGIANGIFFDGNPVTGTVNKTYTRQSSIDEFGFLGRGLDHFGLSVESDADKLVNGLLDDVAYPRPNGSVVFFAGNPDVRVGDVLEFRGAQLHRLEREISGEWADRYTGKLVGRVRELRHRFSGREVRTEVQLTSPLRTVESPLTFMVRSQPGETTLFQFRLDDGAVGVDVGYHLD